MNAARFNLIYDPVLFTPESATLAPGLPQGTFLSTNFSTLGYARFTLSAPKALPQGTVPLILLKGSVPATAPQGAKQVLDIVEVFVNGSLQGDSDDGIHKLGDAPVPLQPQGLVPPDGIVLFPTGLGLSETNPMGAPVSQPGTAQPQGQTNAQPPSNETPAAGNSSTNTPSPVTEPTQSSKPVKVLSRIKEAVVGALLAKHHVTPIEVSQAPTLPIIQSTRDSVRSLSTGNGDTEVSIDLTPSTDGALRSSAATGTNAGDATTKPPATKWQSAFVTTLGTAPSVNPNTTRRVTVR